MTLPRTIFLVGLPGSGKSHFGRYLAARIHFAFTDLDAVIEKTTGQTITRIFREEGEEVFRSRERDALRGLSLNLQVVATGGGTPCFHENMSWMMDRGWTVFLDPPTQVILRRLRGDRKRPLMKGDPETRLLELDDKRREIYSRAHFTLRATSSQAQYEELLQQSENFID